MIRVYECNVLVGKQAAAGHSIQNKHIQYVTRLHRCSLSHNHLCYHITTGIGIGTRIGIGAGKSIGYRKYRSQTNVNLLKQKTTPDDDSDIYKQFLSEHFAANRTTL